MFCTKCGNNVPEGSRFCSVCGNDTQAAPVNQPDAPQSAAQPEFAPQPAPQPYAQSAYEQPQYGQPYGGVATRPNPNTKKIVIIAAVIVAIIAGAWFMFFSGDDPHESPEAVFNAYISAFNSKNADALCDISADLKRSGNDSEQRQRYIEEFNEEFEELRFENAKVKSVEYEGEDRAYVICDVTVIESGESERETDARFPCVKIDGKWYWED